MKMNLERNINKIENMSTTLVCDKRSTTTALREMADDTKHI